MNRLEYSLFILGMFAWLWILGHLIAIKVLGVVSIGEPSSFIIWCELVIAVVIIGLMVKRAIKGVK